MFLPFLNNHGVLGLNARNLLYIKPYNPRRAVAFADDKMKTKAYLSARGIPTARLYARIENRQQLRSFDFSALPDTCVLKPNYGFGGEGIIILKGRRNGLFLEQGKYPVTRERMVAHIEDILDGKFSVNGMPDTAFFEKILVAHESFLPFRPAGLPDIRIIVFNLIPVMAMLRIPTPESGGKANVHLGGIGIGLDLSKGTTTYAAQYHHMITELPHGTQIRGHAIPYWEEMLLISSRIQQITNIGYLAVDLTIDQEQGPVLLEVNARAGLMVQVANLAPLRARLERVKGIQVSTPEKGVRLAQELFGEKSARRRPAQDDDEKPVLATRETLSFAGEEYSMEEPCLIAPEKERTTFSPALIQELKRHALIDDGEGTLRAKFTLGGRKIQTAVEAGDTGPSARAVIGRRDLQGFLIDPSKRAAQVRSGVKKDLHPLDRALAQLDREISLLKNLRPVNLREERERAMADSRYNPMFQFRQPDTDVDELKGRLEELRSDESPLGVLLERKRQELLRKLDLLTARGDAAKFTAASQALYGSPTEALTGYAEATLRSRVACDLPPAPADLLTARQAAPLLEEALTRYGLHDWLVVIRDSLVADCAAGDKRLFLRSGATFSKNHVDALIAHEIETHVLTSENGTLQPYELFRRGFANYLDTQEGLAMYNQNRVLSPYHEKRFNHARGVLATAYALHHSFADTRRYLTEALDYRPDKALGMAIGLKRGISDTSRPGAFTKALVYFRGLRAVEHFVAAGGDIRQLYMGKIALEDLDTVRRIDGVKPAALVPSFLRPQVQTAKNGKSKAKKKAQNNGEDAQQEE